MKINPLALNVVIKRDEAEKLTSGGLHIPTKAEKTQQWGTVVAVGPLVTEVVVGDRVLFEKYGGVALELDDEEIVIVDEDEIYAVEETS